MMKINALIVATMLMITPVFAQTAVPDVPCLTPDVVVGNIIAQVPDADIKSISKEPPYTIVFTSPSMPTDYAVDFDVKGCAINEHEVAKVAA